MAEMSSTTKKIVAVILSLCIVMTAIAATGVFYVPGFSEALGTNKPRDLGVKADPAKFDALLARENVKLNGPATNFDLTANIRYGQSAPMDATVTSEELTSLMQATNNAKGPLKNMQVKLGSNNQLEMSADADLQKFGYPVKGPVYLKGTLEKAGSGSVRMSVSEGAFGLVPVPADVLRQGENGLEDAVNKQLSSMPGMRIDTLSIENGELHYAGAFPQSVSS
jgi:hypothetical protein